MDCLADELDLDLIQIPYSSWFIMKVIVDTYDIAIFQLANPFDFENLLMHRAHLECENLVNSRFVEYFWF